MRRMVVCQRKKIGRNQLTAFLFTFINNSNQFEIPICIIFFLLLINFNMMNRFSFVIICHLYFVSILLAVYMNLINWTFVLLARNHFIENKHSPRHRHPKLGDDSMRLEAWWHLTCGKLNFMSIIRSAYFPCAIFHLYYWHRLKHRSPQESLFFSHHKHIHSETEVIQCITLCIYM